ncbi:hypothetical protein [Sphingomonas corticis]|uniref:Transcriptional regulator n=1 Tax=Sphingomonas corticis TaxID=2722791 RepID=A0ABX1CWV8_9SPHN|nr:hypothetical protein [Sphingomonas corticis]NJR80432.1 hypothetical protein [Sphingomonas corticis]
MRKMHLKAHAPNEGARLLARWIARQAYGAVNLAAVALRLDPVILERLLEGDLIPGDELGRELWNRAGIDRMAFQRRPLCGWFEAPSIGKLAA